MATQTMAILAGTSAEEIAKHIMNDVSLGFCAAQEEFENQFPGEVAKRYRVQVVVTPLD